MTYHSGPTTFQTKGDAQAWLADERRLISQHQWTSPNDRATKAAATEAHRRERTLSAYAESWLMGRDLLRCRASAIYEGRIPELPRRAHPARVRSPPPRRDHHRRHPPMARPLLGPRTRCGRSEGLRSAEGDPANSRGRRTDSSKPLPTQGGRALAGTARVAPPSRPAASALSTCPEHVATALAEHIGARADWKAGDYIWTRHDGQPLSRHTVLSAFKAAVESIGREKMVWHDLRHTANTVAADAGASQATLQARMGHADPKVSAIHLHTSKAHDRRLAVDLGRMAGGNETGMNEV